MSDDAGRIAKVAIPLAATAAAIYLTGGAAAPAVGGGMAGAGAAGAGAAGAEGAGLSFLGAGGAETPFAAGALEGPGAALAPGLFEGSSGWGVAGLGGAASGNGVGSINAAGLTPIEGGWNTPSLGAVKEPVNWREGMRDATTAMYGGHMLNSILGLNDPRPPPFRMAAVEPAKMPSPVGGFQPTSATAIKALVETMANRLARQRKIRFA